MTPCFFQGWCEMERCVGAAAMLPGSERKDLAVQGRGSFSAVFGAWFIFGRFWVTNGRAEGAAVEGRISVGGVVVRWRRSASPVQARWFRSGPRPSKVSQCGWLSPVINSRGLLPMRSTSWLRM